MVRLFHRDVTEPQTPYWSTRSYVFTNDWLRPHIETWKRIFSERGFCGRDDLAYLEVGAFEGASLCWMLENVLTAPSARATVIDVELERKFLRENIAATGAADRVTLTKGRSRFELRALRATFDIIYLDGDHHAAAVFLDIALCWDLLKPGGLLIIDDYRWGLGGMDSGPLDTRPTATVDVFLMAFANQVELLSKDHQVVVRKRERHHIFNFIQLGPLEFHWLTGELVDPRTHEVIPLEPQEVEVLTIFSRNLVSSARPDSLENPGDPVLRDPIFRALAQKIGFTQLMPSELL